jgi:hypothetical protein
MNRNKSVIFMSIVRMVVIAVLISGALAALPPGATSAAAPDAPQAGTACLLLQPAATIGKDAYIKQERPDETKGGDPELRVKNESGKLMRSLLQFDLSGLPSGVVVTSATLSLFVKDASGGAYTINTHQVTNSWNEPQVTWKARDKAAKVLWTNLGSDYNSAVVSSAVVDDTKNIWRTWDLTSLATTWLSNPASNLGVILEAPAGSPHGEKKFKSSDDGTAAQRPKLEICYSSGVAVDPDNSGDGVPGLTRTYAHVVHVGNITSAVNLSAASSMGWTTRVLKDVNGNGVKDPDDTPITVTPAIGPNADYPILVQVDIPLSAMSGASDVTTVTATAQSNGSSDTAKDTTRIGKQIDVQPDNSSYATAGSVIFYGHQIINNGDAQDCMTVAATSSQGWPVLLWQDLNANGVHETSNPNEPPLDSAVCINPGGHFHFVAEVQVPAGATAGTVDRTLITATSNNDPSRTGQAMDTTQVFVNDPPVIDGKYDAIYELSPDASQVCYNSNGTLFGKLSTFYQPTADAVYMVLAIDKDFVDNTYGTNAVGWTNGHTFGNLTGSDHAQFYGFDAGGTKVLDFKLDYLTAASGTPSGYASLGVTGGEGRMNLGSATNIKAWGTSLEYSLNKTGYCSGGACPALTTNSPATNAFYTPNPTYPNWIYDVIYEVKIAKTAFGATGFGSLEVPYIHASPSKVGTNTIYATPGPCPGEIGDTVWKDLNANGVQDAGEPGIDGVQVKLYRDNGDGAFNAATDILVGTQTTSAGGHYLFQNLAANDYFVDVVDATVPAGYQTTTYNDPTPIISLGEGQSYLEADFGYVIGAVIGDFVWEDLNKNGVQDAGEPGLSGVTVNLYDGSGNLIGSTTTDRNGYYSFPNRPAGNYQVGFVAPFGYVFSPQDQGGNDAKDSDANPTTGRTIVFATTGGVPDLTRDAGLYYQPPTACDLTSSIASNFNSTAIAAGRTIWFNSHLNVNGLPAGATVTIYFDQSTVQFTANSTNYSLAVPRAKIIFSPTATSTTTTFDTATQTWVTTVSPGNFNENVFLSGLRFPVPAGGLPGGINPVTWNGRFTTDTPGVTLSWQWSAAVYSTFNTDYNAIGVKPVDGNKENPYANADAAGTPENYKTYVIGGARGTGGTNYTGSPSATGNATPCQTASIGDRVWDDANNNGIQDPGEAGISDVTVRLLENCTTLVATTNTDASGLYKFVTPPGNYCVQFVLPPSYVFSPPNQGGDDARDSDANPTDGKTALTNLFSGENDMTWDAGMGQYASVGDRVWNDLNGNGIQDPGEPGIPNIQVELFDADGNYVDTTTTDANGIYGFDSLTPGDYYLQFGLPDGYVFTAQYQGGDPAKDSDANAVGSTDVFSLAPGDNDPTRDAGAVQVASLGDFVWQDLNMNGIQDAGEPGVPDVNVNLYDGNGNFIDPTTTDANGQYLFSGLIPGDYVVEFVAPAGSTFTLPNQGSDPAVDSDANVITGQTGVITLSPGENDLSWDAATSSGTTPTATALRMSASPGSPTSRSTSTWVAPRSPPRPPMPMAATCSPTWGRAPTRWTSPTSTASWPA